MRWKTRLLIAILTLLPTSVLAQLSASVDDQDHLVLSANNFEVLAVEFQSPGGTLLVSDDATPFQGVLSAGSDLALFYNLGSPLLLDGSITLETKWDSTKRNDVLFQYGTLVDEFPLQPIEGHQRFVDEVSSNAVVAEPPEESVVTHQEIDVTIDLPDDGVFETTFPNNLVFADAGTNYIYFYSENNLLPVRSLTIRSKSGLLIPGGPSLDFASLDSDTPFEVSYASNSDVSIAGDFFVPAGWSGSNFNDLSFDLVTADGERLLVESGKSAQLPEPSSGLFLLVSLLISGTALRRRRNVNLNG